MPQRPKRSSVLQRLGAGSEDSNLSTQNVSAISSPRTADQDDETSSNKPEPEGEPEAEQEAEVEPPAPRKRRRFEDAPPAVEEGPEEEAQAAAQPAKKKEWDMFAEADTFGHQFHVSVVLDMRPWG